MDNKRKKVFNVVLICSLALNLLIGGILLGFTMGGKPPRPFPPHLNWVTEGMQDDKRREIRPLMRSLAKENRQLRKDMRQAQKNLEAAILEEPFNEEAISLAISGLQNNASKLQSSMHVQMLSLMKTMTLEERKLALTRLKSQLRPRHPRGERRPENRRDKPSD